MKNSFFLFGLGRIWLEINISDSQYSKKIVQISIVSLIFKFENNLKYLEDRVVDSGHHFILSVIMVDREFEDAFSTYS